jgi:hypothetical protein
MKKTIVFTFADFLDFLERRGIDTKQVEELR